MLDWQSIVVALLLLWAAVTLMLRAWRLFVPPPGGTRPACGGGSCGRCPSQSAPARELVTLTTSTWPPQQPK